MKNLSVSTMLAVMLALSTTAHAERYSAREYAALSTAAGDNEVEVDHNLDGMAPGSDVDIVAPAGNAPVTSAPPVQTTPTPKPIVKPIMVKKTDSGTDVPAPKTTAKVKAAGPARDIPMIDTQNPVESSPDVNYVTGGIGDEERSSIESAKGDYNLHVMSASINGAFVGDARVSISSKVGSETKEMLNVVAGPLLYVKLPAGSYVLNAQLGEQKKQQVFTVGTKGAPVNVHLGWKVDATRSDQ
jgi:hypothetical protein